MSVKSKLSQASRYTRRAFIVTCANLILFLIIMIRLFYLQVIRSRDFKLLSDKNSIKFVFLEPIRGNIFDRNSRELASSRKVFKLYFLKEKNRDFSALTKELQNLGVKLNLEQAKKVVKRGKFAENILIKEDLNWQELANIQNNLFRLEGINVQQGFTRQYPFGFEFASVIGYLGAPTEKEISDLGVEKILNLKVGQAGLEKSQQKKLIGQSGYKEVEVNANNIIVRQISLKAPDKGQDLTLTINADLQKYIYEQISQRPASVNVLDVNTGQVLAMVSSPGFDPNLFSVAISNDEWLKIINSPSRPLINKSVAKLYPPGSTWKIVTAIAMLESGTDPTRSVFCTGSTKIGNKVFKCWNKHGHGLVNMESALGVSCNVYFYQMAMKIDIDKIHQIALELGFGEKTKIELPSEAKGLVPSKLWKNQVYKSNWAQGDSANSVIGQGYNLVTPLQLAQMMARIISKKKLSPYLIINKESSQQSSQMPDLAITDKSIDFIKNALHKAFNHPGSSGYLIRPQGKPYEIAGKTGTAQVVSADTQNLSEKLDSINKIKSHSLFVGYAPFNEPKYAISVIIDHAGWGSKSAAPLAKDVLVYCCDKKI